MTVIKTFTQHSDNSPPQRWHILNDLEALSDTVIARLSECADEAIAARGAFHIVLAGGNTPQMIYRKLPALTTQWPSWFIYFGDERCLPIGDAERNDAMAQRSWLNYVPIPTQQIFSIPSELGANSGATAYGNLLQEAPIFDLVLLGLGEDGHTASLFPGLTQAEIRSPTLAVHDSPKAPRARVSMSANRLSNAREVWFLVSGEGKREALNQLKNGTDIPAALINPPGGIDIFTNVNCA